MTEIMAYPQYRNKWLEEHPSSLPPKPNAALTPFWLKASILLVFLSSAIVSGSHTVPTIAATILFEIGTLIPDLATQQAIAILGFVMVECATFVVAYMSVLHAGKHRWLLRIVLIFTMTVAISGNLYSTTKALAVNGDTPFLTLVTAVALGLGAPTIALLMGEIFAQVKVEDDRRIRESKAEYQTALRRLDAAILQAHQKYIKDAEAKIEARQSRVLSDGNSNGNPLLGGYSNGNSIGNGIGNSIPAASTLGHKKEPNAREKVEAYFDEYVDAITQDPQVIVNKLGVGKSTVYAVRKERIDAMKGVQS